MAEGREIITNSGRIQKVRPDEAMRAVERKQAKLMPRSIPTKAAKDIIKRLYISWNRVQDLKNNGIDDMTTGYYFFKDVDEIMNEYFV